MNSVILHAKLEAVNRFITYCEETADWIEHRASLVADLQEEPDAGTLIDELTRLVLKTSVPGPTLRLILQDLQKAAAESPKIMLFQQIDSKLHPALWEEIRALGRALDANPEMDQRKLIYLCLKYTSKIVEQLRRDAEVAKIVEAKLLQEIEPGSDDQLAELTGAERRLVKALGRCHLTGEELARELDLSYSGSFKTTLANLVKRGILANDHTGYHVIADFS